MSEWSQGLTLTQNMDWGSLLSTTTQICNILRVQKKEPRYVCQKKTLKVPSKAFPAMFPQNGPYGERWSLSRANGLFIHLCLSKSQKGALPWNVRKPDVLVTRFLQNIGINLWKYMVSPLLCWFSLCIGLLSCTKNRISIVLTSFSVRTVATRFMSCYDIV
jgi:hypothetical protein